jgi:aldehyde:ferredoxin oxidoreductase
MSFGWGGQILRLDLSNRKTSAVSTESYTRLFIGGRGINVKMLYDEVGPEVSMFDPANKVFFGPGVLAGTPAVSSSRLMVTGLGAGGFLRYAGLGAGIPKEIKCAGYDAIVAEGKADKPVYVFINNDSVEFKDASHTWGKDVYETQQLIRDELGKSVEVMCIGPGGENAVAFGSIHSDWGSVAGRGGMGGVMGSKNLKAIAVRGTRGVKLAKPEEFLQIAEEQRKDYASREETIESMRLWGDRWLSWCLQEGGLGARGNFEAYDGPLGWDTMRITKMDDFAEKYGAGWHVCGSCAIHHFMMYDVPGIGKGGAKCTGTTNVTSTLWNNDWKLGFQVYNLANKYGLDIMSITNIIAFLMELYDKEIITTADTDGIPILRGDANAIIQTIHKIGKQEGFGQLFKDGVVQGAKKIGKDAEKYAMANKELELEPYEYRAIKPFALASATNTKDLTGALNERVYNWAASGDKATRDAEEELALKIYGTKEAALPHSYDGAAISTVVDEGRTCACDMIGVCKWVIPWDMSEYYDIQSKLFSFATGVEMSDEDIVFAAQRVVTLERAFNIRRGLTRADDTLPDRFFEEPVPGGPYKGEKLSKTKFAKMIDDYYNLRGYDKNGTPTEETFIKYALKPEWEVFKKETSQKIGNLSVREKLT